MSVSDRDVPHDLRSTANDERDKGDKFERLVLNLLRTGPEWVNRFSDVWFGTALDAAAHQAVPIQRVDLAYLNEAKVDWSQYSWVTPEVLVPIGPKQLRPHQERALRDVCAGPAAGTGRVRPGHLRRGASNASRFEEIGPGGPARADPLRHGSPGAVAQPPLHSVRRAGQVLRSEPADVLRVVAGGARARGAGGRQGESKGQGRQCGGHADDGAAIECRGVHGSAFLCLSGLDEPRAAGPLVDEPGQNWTAWCALVRWPFARACETAAAWGLRNHPTRPS